MNEDFKPEYNKKVKIVQPFDVDYDMDVDDDLYTLSDDDLYGSIDLDEDYIEKGLTEYFNTYPWEDEYRQLFNDIKQVKVSIDWGDKEINVELLLLTDMSDKDIKEDLEGIVHDVFNQDISGDFTLDIDPIQSEPYESGYNPMNDTILYDTDEIDEINVDWELNLDADDKITIENI